MYLDLGTNGQRDKWTKGQTDKVTKDCRIKMDRWKIKFLIIAFSKSSCHETFRKIPKNAIESENLP